MSISMVTIPQPAHMMTSPQYQHSQVAAAIPSHTNAAPLASFPPFLPLILYL